MGPSLLGPSEQGRRKPAQVFGPRKVWDPHFKERSGTEVGELGKLNVSYTMDWHVKEERWMERIGQIWEASFPHVQGDGKEE